MYGKRLEELNKMLLHPNLTVGEAAILKSLIVLIELQLEHKDLKVQENYPEEQTQIALPLVEPVQPEKVTETKKPDHPKKVNSSKPSEIKLEDF